ncbi:MAG TPA: MlaD family protein [Chitinophagaceae bacterium]|nr:MlaD family protein [Chitinophagaceae bacterium]
MKISNEMKVGLLSFIALVLLIVGFNFLKGKDIFNRSKKIYMVFFDLGGLTKSNEVKINGYVIGKVYDLNAKDKNVSGIVATINLSEDVNIPDNSTAVISSPLVGSSYIDIEKGNSQNFLKPGDTLSTRIDSGLFDDVKSQLTPTLGKVREGIDSLKLLLSNVNKLFTNENRASLQYTLANLSQATHNLNKMLDSENGALSRSLNNVSSITENLKNNNDSINATISNARKATAKLAELELKPTIDSLNATISQLKSVVAKIDSKEGSLGALINDRQLYNKLVDAVLSAEILLDDLRTNPKRYVNLSVFGRKDKNGPLTSPAKKDTLPASGN